MGVSKTVIKEGNGPQPKVGDKVTIEYTGWLKDESKPNKKGSQYALIRLDYARHRVADLLFNI